MIGQVMDAIDGKLALHVQGLESGPQNCDLKIKERKKKKQCAKAT